MLNTDTVSAVGSVLAIGSVCSVNSVFTVSTTDISEVKGCSVCQRNIQLIVFVYHNVFNADTVFSIFAIGTVYTIRTVFAVFTVCADHNAEVRHRVVRISNNKFTFAVNFGFYNADTVFSVGAVCSVFTISSICTVNAIFSVLSRGADHTAEIGTLTVRER